MQIIHNTIQQHNLADSAGAEGTTHMNLQGRRGTGQGKCERSILLTAAAFLMLGVKRVSGKILLSHLPCPPASVTNPIWCTRSLLSVRRQVTLHATRDLACDEELYALYGAAYGAHRDYPVGVPPAHRLLKSDIQDLQRPAAFPSARLCALEGKQCAVVLIMD